MLKQLPGGVQASRWAMGPTRAQLSLLPALPALLILSCLTSCVHLSLNEASPVPPGLDLSAGGHSSSKS